MEENISQDMQEYLNSSVFLIKQLKQMLRSHNRMLSISASNGDIASASVLLHNNVALSSIDILLGFEAVKKAQDLTAAEEGLSMDLN